MIDRMLQACRAVESQFGYSSFEDMDLVLGVARDTAARKERRPPMNAANILREDDAIIGRARPSRFQRAARSVHHQCLKTLTERSLEPGRRHGAASCRFATRPVLRTRPGHPTSSLPTRN